MPQRSRRAPGDLLNKCSRDAAGGGQAGQNDPLAGMTFLPNRLLVPAPIKRKVDGGEAMKGTWVNEKGEPGNVCGDESG